MKRNCLTFDHKTFIFIAKTRFKNKEKKKQSVDEFITCWRFYSIIGTNFL